MERFYTSGGSGMVPATGPALTGTQPLLCLLALTKQKPVFLSSVAALMKVTDATTDYI